MSSVLKSSSIINKKVGNKAKELYEKKQDKNKRSNPFYSPKYMTIKEKSNK